jgi:hypothetical protein
MEWLELHLGRLLGEALCAAQIMKPKLKYDTD